LEVYHTLFRVIESTNLNGIFEKINCAKRLVQQALKAESANSPDFHFGKLLAHVAAF